MEALKWESAGPPSESEVKWKVRISAAGQEPDPDVVRECLQLPGCAAQMHCCVAYSLHQWLFYILYLPAIMLDCAGTELQEILQRHRSGDTDLAPRPAASRPALGLKKKSQCTHFNLKTLYFQKMLAII